MQFLDYGTKEGTQKYDLVTRSLPTLFNGDPDSVQTFIKDIQARAVESGWNNPAASITNILISRNAIPPSIGIVNYNFKLLEYFELFS